MQVRTPCPTTGRPLFLAATHPTQPPPRLTTGHNVLAPDRSTYRVQLWQVPALCQCHAQRLPTTITPPPPAPPPAPAPVWPPSAPIDKDRPSEPSRRGDAGGGVGTDERGRSADSVRRRPRCPPTPIPLLPPSPPSAEPRRPLTTPHSRPPTPPPPPPPTLYPNSGGSIDGGGDGCSCCCNGCPRDAASVSQVGGRHASGGGWSDNPAAAEGPSPRDGHAPSGTKWEGWGGVGALDTDGRAADEEAGYNSGLPAGADGSKKGDAWLAAAWCSPPPIPPLA